MIIHWECQMPSHLCSNNGGYTKTYREAKKLARAHSKATGHVVRAERIETEMFGWVTMSDEETAEFQSHLSPLPEDHPLLGH